MWQISMNKGNEVAHLIVDRHRVNWLYVTASSAYSKYTVTKFLPIQVL